MEDRIERLYYGLWHDMPPLPNEVMAVPSMLHPQERRLLYWLAREHYTGEGVIVDGGPFVGGSTVPLAAGLVQNACATHEKRIRSYDLFMVDKWMALDPAITPLLGGRTEGESFLPVYQEHTAEYASLIDVCPGDVVSSAPIGSPIEILFLDLAKTVAVNDWIVANWFPLLIPGRSVVVQQDFFDYRHYWIPVTMEYFSEYFDLVTTMEWATAVYVVKKELPRVDGLCSTMDPERVVSLLEQSIRRFDPFRGGALACTLACFLKYVIRGPSFDHFVAEARARYASFPRIQWSLSQLQ